MHRNAGRIPAMGMSEFGGGGEITRYRSQKRKRKEKEDRCTLNKAPAMMMMMMVRPFGTERDFGEETFHCSSGGAMVGLRWEMVKGFYNARYERQCNGYTSAA